MQRKIPLVTEEIYHIFNRSIAHYVIFNSPEEYQRIVEALLYYQNPIPTIKLSSQLRSTKQKEICPTFSLNTKKPNQKLVEIIAYCLMPTHFHLILKQLADDGIMKFIATIQNSYAKYFNLRHNRKGPLWEGRFKNVLVKTDEQLLHLTRYIHLNPVTANIIHHPEDWEFSSYAEYVSSQKKEKIISNPAPCLEIIPSEYKKFVHDHIDYQKKLALIKHLIAED